MIRSATVRSRIEPNWQETEKKRPTRKFATSYVRTARKDTITPDEVCRLMLMWRKV